METIQLRSALRAVGRGWPVFPLYGVSKDGTCNCGKRGCTDAGKHPMTAHGFKDATTDDKKIREWWDRHPKANIGIATGRQSGLVVLDIDPRHGGPTSLEQFESEFGPLPVSPEVRTGGGGLHKYFRHPGGRVKSPKGILPGLDVCADGAYVVGAGSLHESGNTYMWMEGKTPEKIALPTLPATLRQLIDAKSPRSQPGPVIPETQRNSTLASMAGTMRHRGMTQQSIVAALLQENLQRCDPPLSDTEVIGVARSIARYAPGDSEMLSASYRDGVQAERISLKFRTGSKLRMRLLLKSLGLFLRSLRSEQSPRSTAKLSSPEKPHSLRT